MFKKALKRSLPFTVGAFIGLVIVGTFMGIETVINSIFPMLVGICVDFCVNLYFVKREDKGDQK